MHKWYREIPLGDEIANADVFQPYNGAIGENIADEEDLSAFFDLDASGNAGQIFNISMGAPIDLAQLLESGGQEAPARLQIHGPHQEHKHVRENLRQPHSPVPALTVAPTIEEEVVEIPAKKRKTMCGKRTVMPAQKPGDTRQQERAAPISEPEHRCSHCQRPLRRAGDVAKHMESHQQNPFTCLGCNHTFAEKEAALHHIRICASKKMPNLLPFKCRQCSAKRTKNFLFEEDLIQHCQQKHNGLVVVGKSAGRLALLDELVPRLLREFKQNSQ